MTTQQLRKEAISKKRSLLMAIRMNESYSGYSSMSNGHSKEKRAEIVKTCKEKLDSLVIPEIKTAIIGYIFEYKNGDYIGLVANPDIKEAIDYVIDLEGCKESDIKWKERKVIL